MSEKACYIYSCGNIELDRKSKQMCSAYLRDLILNKNVSKFYFADTKDLECFCFNLIQEYKYYYPHITRILVENDYKLELEKTNEKWLENLAPIFEILIEDYKKEIEYYKHRFIINKCDFVLFYKIPVTRYKRHNPYEYAKSKQDCEVILLNEQ